MTHLHEPSTHTIHIFPARVDDDLKRRIRAEFTEMPGMHLSTEQAARLWSSEYAICKRTLGDLVASGFLRRDQFDRYAVAHTGH